MATRRAASRHADAFGVVASLLTAGMFVRAEVDSSGFMTFPSEAEPSPQTSPPTRAPTWPSALLSTSRPPLPLATHAPAQQSIAKSKNEEVRQYRRVLQHAGNRAVCAEVSRLSATCGHCGPQWGGIHACADLCTTTPFCNFFVFSDRGCRLYSACDATWTQKFGGGSVATSIYQRFEEKASRPAVYQERLLKAVCYRPTPLKESQQAQGLGPRPAGKDYSSTNGAAFWSASQGRGDLAIIRSLGANAVQIYGNDPSVGHAAFFDAASEEGLQVIAGFSDFPFSQPVKSCVDTKFNCFTQVRQLYMENLVKGFATNLEGPRKRYHPSLRAVVLFREPEVAFVPFVGSERTPVAIVRAIASAIDGILDAETELGIEGSVPNLTVVFSSSVCHECTHFDGRPAPALGLMGELRAGMRDPEKFGYKPKHDLWAAYNSRFMNSINTALIASDFRHYFLDAYERHFDSTPVFISEYANRNLWVKHEEGLADLLSTATRGSGLLVGASYFEFQSQHGGDDKDTGIFGLGSSAIRTMEFGVNTYTVWCLYPKADRESGNVLAVAVAGAFGGEGPDQRAMCPEGESGQKGNDVTDQAVAEDNTFAPDNAYPIIEQHGFLKFTGAGVQKAQVLEAARASLSTWLAVHPGSLRTKVLSENATEHAWMVAYTVRLPVLQYDETCRVILAVKRNCTGFRNTLLEELALQGADRARLSATLAVQEFTSLQGEKPITFTTTSITLTVTTTSTSTTTLTSHWVEMSGFISLETNLNGSREVRPVIVATLKSKLVVEDGHIHEVSVFQSRRLVVKTLPARHLTNVQLEVSYVLRVPDSKVEPVKNLANQMAAYPTSFESELKKQVSLWYPRRIGVMLRVTAFSEIQCDMSDVTTLATSSSLTITTSTIPRFTASSVQFAENPAEIVVISAIFNCQEGYETWRAGWSRSKKTWCCEHENKGCKELAVEDGQDSAGSKTRLDPVAEKFV